MDPIKHISFDCWGTILKSNYQYSIARTEYLYERFGAKIHRLDIVDAIKSSKEFSNRLEQTLYKSFDPQLRMAIALDFLEIQQCASDIEEILFCLDRIAMRHRPLLIDEDFSSFLEELHRQGITTNISSNTANFSGFLLRRIFDSYDLHFDFFVFSDQTGFVKPDKRFFEVVARGAQINPSSILHVGDDPEADCNGALRCGMQSMLVTGKIDYDAIFDRIFKKSDHVGI